MGKKVIIFDLDETLRKLEFDRSYQNVMKVRLRPNIEELLDRLIEANENDIDIMIYTTASSLSAQKYFIEKLPEVYRDLFCRIISRDNGLKIRSGSREEQVYGYNNANKPVTAIEGYNQILFFDDNLNEEDYLSELYSEEEDAPNKQVIFASYRYEPLKPYYLYGYKKISEFNTEIAKKVNLLFKLLLEDPGCSLMIEKINKFEQTQYSKGLTVYKDDEKLTLYKEQISELEEEIEELIDKDADLYKKYNEYVKEYLQTMNNGQNGQYAEVR